MSTRTRNNTTREVAEFLKTLDRVAVTTHVGADGDAIGASAALVRLMRALGAAAIFCHAEEVPNYLWWLLAGEAFRELPPDHDLLVVDASRSDRTGVPIPESGARLNLDHHEDNPLYGEFNLVNPQAAASAGSVAEAEVHERINRRGTVEQLNIVGVSLANARRYGEVLISTVDNDDYARTGATELDSKESIDQLRSVEGIDMVAHLREVPQGTKGSLRSETIDVGEIARTFGGGGHKLAAGYTREGMRPEEAKTELLGVLKNTSVNLGEGR